MRYQHLCASHASEIEFNEPAALEFWNGAMHQGVSTYAHCRWDCATNYLSAAYEIACIRLHAGNNEHFTSLHVLKPVELLLEIHLCEKTYKAALALLDSTAQLVKTCTLEGTELVQWALSRFTLKVREHMQAHGKQDTEQHMLLQKCDAMLNPGTFATTH